MALFLLGESASGYALFEKMEAEEISDQSSEVQQTIVEFKTFSKMLKLRSFVPFTDAENALSNCNDLSEGILNPFLKSFLDTNFTSKIKKKFISWCIRRKTWFSNTRSIRN